MTAKHSPVILAHEAWTERLGRDVEALHASRQAHWAALLQQALSATSSHPSRKWLKQAEEHLAAVGADAVQQALSQWFPLVADPADAGMPISPENAVCLRGLVWMVPLLPSPESLLRELTSLTMAGYKKIPGLGPRGVKVGNAAVAALSRIATEGAIAQLAVLKSRVKFAAAQKEIEKGLQASAVALGIPRDQIEELAVPDCGLDSSGQKEISLKDDRAVLSVSGTTAELQWFDSRGKLRKSVPSWVRKEFPQQLRELQNSLKDLRTLLPAQRDRIEGLFLQQASWAISNWRRRYLDHPLLGTITRRLIWCVDGVPVLFREGTPVDLAGQPVEHGRTAEVTLWHPAGRTVDEVSAWRQRLEELTITQPFKQAYREVYLLTDAERRTGNYSNRFAAHVLRQHQFHALCAARGWKSRLRMFVDAEYPPPTRELPTWDLRAEFWVEPVGDHFGADTNDAGVFLRVATDQVRFYRLNAPHNTAHAIGGRYVMEGRAGVDDEAGQPLPLDQIPPLVFSEIMRDVDLFVGVASVGNDPTWQDGGPQGRFRDYWEQYSFGELSGTAATRKDVLQRLIPRLKIAGRCTFTDRFLVVRGDRRTYKIHLGSGNILMEPSDQYLCIVPDSRPKSGAATADLYLPFEGDQMLSIIVSKALLLADDTRITDPSIVSQIHFA